MVDGVEDESQVRFDGGDGAFDESDEKVNGVQELMPAPLFFLEMKDSLAYGVERRSWDRGGLCLGWVECRAC